ncbi:MAG: transcription termination factor NusA [Bacilli bacterium]|nr:transcription termination factor NusA [Bacilli bacterium]
MAINVSEFNSALDAIEVNNGISRERVIEALKESMIKGYKKELGGDDADVRVNLDLEKGILEMYQVKIVKKDVEDDFLEISEEDAKKVDKKYKDGDEFPIYASIDQLRKATAMSIKSILRQKFAEAEKEVLYQLFQDKIGTIISGRVETCDERGCSVNIGRTSVFLPKKEMIGDERYITGDTIKLYVNDVDSASKNAHIVVTRAGEGFLKCLMNEDIHEIYDGTIIIKSIAREAGERSKVAVYSNDPNVDPAGACIGPNGSRIQKIVGQLGNGQSKEKIDIIAYSDNIGLYIMEALKPARVVGISLNEETKSATVVVKDDSLSLAIGRKGVNVRLAVKLTGYNIDIKIETDALNEGFEYLSFEQLQAEEIEARNKKAMQIQQEAYEKAAAISDVLPGLPSGYVAPQARNYEDETNDFDESLREKVEMEEATTISPEVNEEDEVVEEVKETEVKETEVKVAPKETVKTTTTLEDLEKSLENDNKKQANKTTSRKNKKKEEAETEVEEAPATKAADPKTFMSIYTEEELKQMEEEENENDDLNDEEDDVDYDEYDDYYDQK